MSDETIWRIGEADLLDTYKAPLALGDVVWTAPPPGEAAPRQRWPLFHPSEADPEAGYRPHPYTVRFALGHAPAGAYALRLDYLVIAPRLAYLELRVNGVAGLLYPRPQPSRSGEIRLLSGLHTTIYADGAAEVIIPAALLRPGPNEIVLTARDDGEQIVVENVEAIKRLDRMANGAGLIYQALSLARLGAPPSGSIGRVELAPTVLYRVRPDGALEEQCFAYVELSQEITSSLLHLDVRRGDQHEQVTLELPGAAFGHLRLPFALPDGAPIVDYALRGEGGAAGFEASGTMRRRRKWSVYITPHAHTDIGYTHRQWEVAERLCRNIDAALDALAAEERAGAAPAFSYHLDASWALEHYLATRDEGRRRQLIAQIAARRIGLAAGYVDLLTQYAALEDQIRNGELSEDVLRPHGLRATFAAVVDVASITASMPDLLAGAGVRYLVHANNQDRGPFRLNGGLHRRSPFYWEGQAGGRVLVWLAKMYCELRKVCGSPPLPAAAERGLDMWLAEYERDDYAPDAVLLYGQEADNTDLDPQPADFVRRWNERYAFPRLIPCDVAAFFEHVERRFGERLETMRGDGGAYWEDGAGSTIAPAIDVRQAQAALPAAERLESLAVLHHPGWAYPGQHYDAAWRQILLFDEHTWGAFLSCTDPDALLQHDQWATKEHMARDAAEWARRLLHGAAARHSLSWSSAGREVVVYNPHSWPLADLVRVEVARGERAYDASGAPVPMRVVRATETQQVVELWVEALPGLSYRRLALRQLAAEASPAQPSPPAGPLTVENEHYRLTFDPRRGALASWHDKALGRELADAADEWGLGQLIYAAGGEGTRLVSNQADLPDGDPRLSGAFELLECAVEHSELGVAVRLRGLVPHGELAAEWLLPAGARRVDVAFTYTKAERREKEAVYIAFPLALPGATVRSDSQLGWVDWHRQQLPGGCKEWLPLQSAVLAERPGAAVLIASPDIPLFCVGDVVRGRWPRELDLTGGRIFSYVLNNYWHTNYKASQGGPIRFSYRLTSAARFAPDEAFRFGWAARRPPYAQRMSYQDFRSVAPPYDEPAGGTLAHVEPAQAHLSTLKPARHAAGWVARFQEIGGAERAASLRIPGRPIARAWACDLLERDGAPLPVEPDGSLRVTVPAWGLATVRIELAP